MRNILTFLLLLKHTMASPETIMVIEYTTNGQVALNIMNITFHTTELHVTLLGCDVGYYDQYMISPPTQSTLINPFHCLACECEIFESMRSEDFIPLITN